VNAAEALSLDPELVRWIRRALEDLRFGEVIIRVHEGQVQGIDVKSRRRVEPAQHGQEPVA